MHRSLLDTFEAAAVKYKKRHGTIPVLVLDNANRLADELPEFLDHLQDRAKYASDNGLYRVVFVFEGSVSARMQGWRLPLCVLYMLISIQPGVHGQGCSGHLRLAMFLRQKLYSTSPPLGLIQN